MKWTIASLLTLALAAGCSDSNKSNQKAEVNPGVADIPAAAPAPQPAPAPAPVAAAPAAAPIQPVAADTSAAQPAAAGGSKYTVQKGDTLWRIAQSRYGSGNQWQRIASANPGLNPNTLKAGQTITIP